MKIRVEEGGGLLGGFVSHEVDITEIPELWSKLMQETGFDHIKSDETVMNIDPKVIKRMSYYSKVETDSRGMIYYLGGAQQKGSFNFVPIADFVREVLAMKELK